MITNFLRPLFSIHSSGMATSRARLGVWRRVDRANRSTSHVKRTRTKTTVVSIRSASDRLEALRVDALVDCSYRRVLRCLDSSASSWVSGFLDSSASSWVSGFVDEFVDVWVRRRIRGCLDSWVSGFLGVWIPWSFAPTVEFLGVWIPRSSRAERLRAAAAQASLTSGISARPETDPSG